MNKKLLPIKIHFFLFMGAMGPILPFLGVFGKQLEISEVVMGCINAVLPFFFLFAKPLFGFVIDYFHPQRKLLFMILVCIMSISFALMYVIPTTCHQTCKYVDTHNSTFSENVSNGSDKFPPIRSPNEVSSSLSISGNVSDASLIPTRNPLTEHVCELTCESDNLYSSMSFWMFVVFMSVGCIGFNIVNSTSDAICFDMLGDGAQSNYGKQRVFGTLGFGLTALLGGYAIDFYSRDSHVKDYTPAFIILIVFSVLDVVACFYIRLPKINASKNIMKDISKVIREPYIKLFLMFAVLAGFCDGMLIYNLFWFLEDLAKETNTFGNIKLLQGLTVAAETLFGEVIFFSFSGNIINMLGYGHCLTLCFFCYAVRLFLGSIITNPWYILPIELFMQGPTYALCYTTIVAYASAISPPGTSATMQGLIAGVDDGFGYALASLVGGILYQNFGGRIAFQVFSLVALFSSIAHWFSYSLFLKSENIRRNSVASDQKTPNDLENNASTPLKTLSADDS